MKRIALVVVGVMLFCISPSQAGLQPSIFSQSFTSTRGELKLKIYGNDFRVSSHRPELYLNGVQAPIDKYSDTYIVTMIDLPIRVGIHSIEVRVSTAESNIRELEFSEVLRAKVNNDRKLLDLEPVIWGDEPTLIEIVEEVEEIPEVTEIDYEVIVEANQVVPLFTDIAVVPWLNQYLPTLLTNGAIRGFEDGTFRPLHAVSRVEALKMMIESLNVDMGYDFTEVSFEDVPEDFWGHPYIEMANALEIMIELEGNKFSPNEPITRLNVINWLLDIDKVVNGREYYRDGIFQFEDLDLIGNNAISPLVKMEILVKNQKFRPNDALTRAEWTKILDLFLQRRDFDGFIQKRKIL